MTNFDLEKLLSENYCDTFESLETTDKERFYQLYKEPKKSLASKRKVYLRVALAMLLVASVAIGTVAARASDMTMRDMLAARAEKDNVHLTDEKLDELASRMTITGAYDPDDPNGHGLSEMGDNDNGQKYGDIKYDFDLFTVSGVDSNGNDIVGYCYTDEFKYMTGDVTSDWCMVWDFYDDVVEWQNDRDSGKLRNWVYVFEENGVRIIGKWIQSLEKDYEELNEKGIRTGFVTNEELETGIYDDYIYDGFDSVIYEARVMEKLESLCVTYANKMPLPADSTLPEMGENEKGQKYGDMMYNFELQPLYSQRHNSPYHTEMIGYCYTDDYKDIDDTRTPWLYDISEWDEVRKNTRNWVYVYESDGETIIGKYFCTPRYRVYEDDFDTDELRSGFYTLKELEAGEYDENDFYDGNGNGEKYEEKVQKRQLYFDTLRELGKL